jgi:hypothetical protein
MTSNVLLNPISPLRHVFPAAAGRIVFKGGGGGPTTSTVQQTNLPEYVRPQFERLISRAEDLSAGGYTPYTGQRVATEGMGDINAAYDITRGVAGSGVAGLPQAMGVTGQNMLLGQQIAQQAGVPYRFGPSRFSQFQPTTFGEFQERAADPFSGFAQQQFGATQVSPFAGFQEQRVDPFAAFREAQFQAGRAEPFAGFEQQQVTPFAEFEATQADQFQFDPTQRFTGAAVEEYMSPFMQSVVARQQEDARRQFQEQAAGRSARAVQAGAFGGSRQAVQEGIAERGLLDRLADIQATGTQQAFEQATQMFGADRAAEFARQQAQAGELARTQGIGAQEAARVQEARARELARTQGIGVEEARRVQEAQAGEMARVQGLDIQEQARVQQAQAAEQARLQEAQAQEIARVQGISIEEARRVQAAEAAELGRVQGIDVQEQARIQQARAAEAARVQAAEAAELARTQGISIDEARRVQEARAAEAARVQGIQAGELGRVQAANAAERARVEAAQAAENRAARQQQLEALGFSSAQAQQLVDLGSTGRAADIQAAQLLENIGRSQRAFQQEGLDIGYQDFLRQQAFPEQQLQFLSSILRGVPTQPSVLQTAYAPYNPLQQLAGAGLAGIGLYRGLQ